MQERALVRNGKTLLSGIDPVRRAEKTADAIPIKDRTLYFCPSPLYGYGLARLLSRMETETPNSAILCIEADAELYELSIKNVEASLTQNKKLHITNICEAAGLCAIIREKWGERAFRRVETVRFSGGWQLFPEMYDSLCEALRHEIAVGWSNTMTLVKLGRLYIRNFMRNLSLVPRFPSIENLSFGESPVLVLGAGPSLDKTLDVLTDRFAENLAPESRPFKIICVDTCLGALKDRQITPDLVVILESQHWNLRDFIGCRGWNVPFAVDLSALPQSTLVLGEEEIFYHEPTRTDTNIRGEGGERREKGAESREQRAEGREKREEGFLFFTPWTSLRIFERTEKAGLLPVAIPPLGSVGLTAVEIARRVTRGKIICAGLDFSFTADKYHARGTPGHRGKLNAQTRLRGILNAAAFDAASFAAVSKNGLSVRTNPIMQNYRALFEQEFGGDSRLFDIEGCGLSLGIKTLSLGALKKGTPLRGVDDINLHSVAHRKLQQDEKKREGFSLSSAPGEERKKLTQKVSLFFESEKKRLEELKAILTGEASAQERLSVLVDECDYLWAHFPDCSGGRRPELWDNSPAALSFLKRVRAEIDPMVGVVERVISVLHSATQ